MGAKGTGFWSEGGEKGEARCCDGCYAARHGSKPYYRRWAAYLRGERIGEVLAATERAACLRAIQRFKIKDEDRAELEVRRVATSSNTIERRMDDLSHAG